MLLISYAYCSLRLLLWIGTEELSAESGDGEGESVLSSPDAFKLSLLSLNEVLLPLRLLLPDPLENFFLVVPSYFFLNSASYNNKNNKVYFGY